MKRLTFVGADAAFARMIGVRLGAEWAIESVSSLAEISEVPDAIVTDLTLPNVIETITAWRTSYPDALIAAWLTIPRKELWEEAERAGCDLVANRGSLPMRLKTMLASWTGRAGRRRIKLFTLQDVAGRLGVVHRLDDEATGPIAIYHVRGSLFAAADRCPHAGQQLSLGELDETVITCPGHGSRFDVATGERVRGPGDVDIATFRIAIENQEVFLEIEATQP